MSSTKTKPASAKDLRIFAAIVATGVSGLAALRGWWPGLYAIMAAFLIIGLVLPKALHWPYVVWMKLGLAMGFVSQRVILGVTYFLVITPVALFFKITGRDKLNLKRKSSPSHWMEYDAHPKTVERYRKLF